MYCLVLLFFLLCFEHLENILSNMLILSNNMLILSLSQLICFRIYFNVNIF